MRVKGRDKPVAIFEPLGLRLSLPRESKQLRARHKQALMLYREQRWDAAEREFFSRAQAEPGRALYRIYGGENCAFPENLATCQLGWRIHVLYQIAAQKRLLESAG